MLFAVQYKRISLSMFTLAHFNSFDNPLSFAAEVDPQQTIISCNEIPADSLKDKKSLLREIKTEYAHSYHSFCHFESTFSTSRKTCQNATQQSFQM